MPDILHMDAPRLDAIIAAYYDELVAISGRALMGEINERLYQRHIIKLANDTISVVFLLAGGDQTNAQAAAWLREQAAIAASSARKLAADLFDGRYSQQQADGQITQTAEDGRNKLLGRLALWTFVLGQAHHRGVLAQPAWMPDINGTWRVGDTEHCSTCLSQDGVTLPRSGWLALAARGIEPQGRGLECGGWKCQCEIVWEK